MTFVISFILSQLEQRTRRAAPSNPCPSRTSSQNQSSQLRSASCVGRMGTLLDPCVPEQMASRHLVRSISLPYEESLGNTCVRLHRIWKALRVLRILGIQIIPASISEEQPSRAADRPPQPLDRRPPITTAAPKPCKASTPTGSVPPRTPLPLE